jgi:hypothetical protein
MRSGPISLFTEYETDFFIIKDDDGMNNLTWKEKIAFCRQGSIEDYIQLSKNTRFYNNEEISNVRFSISANEINWEEYEIVICLDACVSDTVTKKFSNVTWCYYISEGCMPEAKNSRIKALDGYDYFLNQRFRFDLDYIRDPNLEHEVDFPYHLNSPKSMRKLLGKESFSNKSGIFVDKDTRPLLSSEQVNALEKFGPVRFTGGTIDVVLRELAAVLVDAHVELSDTSRRAAASSFANALRQRKTTCLNDCTAPCQHEHTHSSIGTRDSGHHDGHVNPFLE